MISEKRRDRVRERKREEGRKGYAGAGGCFLRGVGEGGRPV